MLDQVNINIFMYLYLSKTLQIDTQYKNIILIKIIANYRSIYIKYIFFDKIIISEHNRLLSKSHKSHIINLILSST